MRLKSSSSWLQQLLTPLYWEQMYIVGDKDFLWCSLCYPRAYNIRHCHRRQRIMFVAWMYQWINSYQMIPSVRQFPDHSPLAGTVADSNMSHRSLPPTIPLYDPSPWTWTRFTDLPLMNKIWQKKQIVTSKIWLQKDCGFLLFWAPSLSLCLFLSELSELSLWGIPGASLWVVLWRSPWVSLAHSQPGPESLSPTKLEELNSANSHLSELRSASWTCWDLGCLQPWPRACLETVRGPDSEVQLFWVQIPDPQKLWDPMCCWSC